MNKFELQQFSLQNNLSSVALRKFLQGLSQTASALIHYSSDSVVFTTDKTACQALHSERLQANLPTEYDAANTVVGSEIKGLSPRDLEELELAPLRTEGRSWKLLSFALTNGDHDRLALALDESEDLALTANYLTRIWPILREDCLKEHIAGPSKVIEARGDGWGLLDQVQVALIVLDGAGLMYRLNRAGRQILDDGQILKRGKGGIFAANDADNNNFRAAIAEQASSDAADDVGSVVFVHNKTCNTRVPISLSRFMHEGETTRFVVATLPLPIRARRIEELAKQLGLSASEARVASLIQRGLSNRDAAEEAGFKQETFNTYAKRVLNKLDVRGRTEMAQLLTWQISGGRNYDSSGS